MGNPARVQGIHFNQERPHGQAAYLIAPDKGLRRATGAPEEEEEMSLYSLNPIEFQDTDFQLADQERRREFSKLHGDSAAMWDNDIERANARIQQLEAQILRLLGAMYYLETSKIPWLQRELERERSRRG